MLRVHGDGLALGKGVICGVASRVTRPSRHILLAWGGEARRLFKEFAESNAPIEPPLSLAAFHSFLVVFKNSFGSAFRFVLFCFVGFFISAGARDDACVHVAEACALGVGLHAGLQKPQKSDKNHKKRDKPQKSDKKVKLSPRALEVLPWQPPRPNPRCRNNGWLGELVFSSSNMSHQS